MSCSALKVLEEPDCLPVSTHAVREPQKCVLLIEDSEDAMLYVQYAFEEFGHSKYRLQWATCLTEGLMELRKGGIDVVLLDLGLPDSSGPVAYSWVRQTSDSVPVLVLTGDARDETETSVFASGANDYLVKDQVSGPILIDAIENALSASKKRNQSQKTVLHKFTQRFEWK